MNRIVVVGLLLVGFGCSQGDTALGPAGVVVKGRVIKGGQPIPVPRPDVMYGLVEVALIPEGSPPDSTGEPASVEVDGTFRVTGTGKGLPAGKYKVTVRQMIDGKDTFKDAFSPAKTPITVELPSSRVGSEVKLDDIDLEKYLK
jgi:hypothetical protein